MADGAIADTPEALAARAEIEDVRRRISRLDDDALDLIFRQARSHNIWQDRPVTDDQLHELYEIVRLGPTAHNGCPLRIKFIRSEATREKLYPALSPGNVEKARTAPVVAILAYDMGFHDELPALFPHKDVSGLYRDNPEKTETAAFRNSSLQGAYFLIAARALGLDTGPMSGFNNAVVDDAFFTGTGLRSNFLCALGYGDVSGVFARSPRLPFDKVCEII